MVNTLKVRVLAITKTRAYAVFMPKVFNKTIDYQYFNTSEAVILTSFLTSWHALKKAPQRALTFFIFCGAVTVTGRNILAKESLQSSFLCQSLSQVRPAHR